MKNKIKTYVVTGILLVFSFCFLPVNAADLTVSNTTPQIFFDDTDVNGGFEWVLDGYQDYFRLWNQNTSEHLLWFNNNADMRLGMTSVKFVIEDQVGNDIVYVHRDAPLLSLDIQSDGDVSLAGGDVFIDTSSNRLGIGTTTPAIDLEIQSTQPAIIFDDETASSTDWYVGNFDNDFEFWTKANGTGGPVSTQIMTLDAQTGFVGIGSRTPTSPLHLKSAAGNTKMMVEETNAVAAPRTLFQLKNKGNTKFGVLNTDAGVEWAFANPGTGFRLSRQGSGVVEMEIFNNGDMTIAGLLTEGSDVNSKQDIKPVNGLSILEKLTNLEISEWSYKDAPTDRHVGPMAQDFYAAFGLGHTDTGIATLDSSGVALAAIKALIEENTALKEKNLSLEQRDKEMQQQINVLQQQNQRIEELVMRMVMDQAEPVVMK